MSEFVSIVVSDGSRDAGLAMLLLSRPPSNAMTRQVYREIAAAAVELGQRDDVAAVILFGDATHVLGPFGTYAVDVLHAKTAALVYPDIPGITEGAAAIEAGLKAAGVSVTAWCSRR